MRTTASKAEATPSDQVQQFFNHFSSSGNMPWGILGEGEHRAAVSPIQTPGPAYRIPDPWEHAFQGTC